MVDKNGVPIYKGDTIDLISKLNCSMYKNVTWSGMECDCGIIISDALGEYILEGEFIIIFRERAHESTTKNEPESWGTKCFRVYLTAVCTIPLLMMSGGIVLAIGVAYVINKYYIK